MLYKVKYICDLLLRTTQEVCSDFNTLFIFKLWIKVNDHCVPYKLQVLVNHPIHPIHPSHHFKSATCLYIHQFIQNSFEQCFVVYYYFLFCFIGFLVRILRKLSVCLLQIQYVLFYLPIVRYTHISNNNKRMEIQKVHTAPCFV